MNKFYLFLLTLFATVGIAQAAVAPTALYIQGQGMGWSGGSNVSLTRSNDGTFFYGQFSFASTISNCEFSFKDGNDIVYAIGVNSNDARQFSTIPSSVTLTKGLTHTIMLTGSDRYTNPIYVKVDFSQSETNPTAYFSKTTPFTDTSAAPEAPQQLYLWSDSNGYGGNGTPLQLNKSDDGTVFYGMVTLAPKDGNTTDYFIFSISDTETNVATTYGATAGGISAALTQQNSLVRGSTNNFLAPEGKYNLQVVFADPANPYFFITPYTETDTDHPYIFFDSSEYHNGIAMTKTTTAGVYSYTYTATTSGNRLIAFHKGALATAGTKLDLSGADANTYGGSANKTPGAWTVDAAAKPLVASAQGEVAFYTTANQSYTITVDTNDWTCAITTTTTTDPNIKYPANKEKGYYYLSGDINVWSDVSERNFESSKAAGYGTEDGTFEHDNAGNYSYKQDDPDNPYLKFETIENMNKKFRFEYIGAAPFAGLSAGNWYKLDLTAKGTGDRNGHVGRLCGQFKIIGGDLTQTAEGFGVDGGANDAYYNNMVKTGVEFTGGKSNGGQNYHLYNTVVDNAVLYFNRDNGHVYVTGDAKDFYVYYAKVDATTFEAPAKTYLGESAQSNNFVPKDPWENSSVSDTEGGYDFSWQKYAGENNAGVNYTAGKNTFHFPYVWRKKIDSAIAHHMPMSYLVSVTHSTTYKDAEGNDQNHWFNRARLECEDEWFIDNSVDIYVRYLHNDMNESTRVWYNAFTNRYDENHVKLDDPYYMSEDFLPMYKPQTDASGNLMYDEKGNLLYIQDTNEDGSLKYDEDNNPVYKENIVDITSGEMTGRWHKSPKPIDDLFTENAYAIIATNYGHYLPYGDAKGSPDDLAKVQILGGDVYITLDEADDEFNILYSHLNGTFCKGDAGVVQINAEYFEQDANEYNYGKVDYTIGNGIKYEFIVEHMDENKVKKTVASSGRIDLPFFDWNVADLDSGIYNVRVKVYDGLKTYTCDDTYVIYPDRSTKTNPETGNE